MNTTSIARKLAAVVLAATATLATLTATTSPAEAAPATYGTAKICFKAPTGLGGYGIYNRTVIIDAYTNTGWVQVGTVVPTTSGCLTQALPTGSYWRFRVFHLENRIYYLGTSNYVLPQNGAYYNLGTLYLQTTRG